MSNGFTFLAFVRSESPLCEGLSNGSRSRLEREILEDCAALLGVRWGIDCTISQHGNKLYCYGTQSRFTVGLDTLRNALGTMTDHVELIKGGALCTQEDLIRYSEAKIKWKVPDQVTSSTTGPGEQGQAATYPTSKRLRF